MPSFPYHRLVVIGTTSSGKSTLAERIATRFGLDFIELDALHWEPNWQEAPLDVFRERVRAATQAEQRWIVAGNYSVVRDLVWTKAEAIIWLDYPFLLVLRQLTRRTFTRWWTQELLWVQTTNRFGFTSSKLGRKTAVPLAVQNVLAQEARDAAVIVFARISAFGIDPLQTSK
ncbi:MAG: hypothetical protein U0X92_10665 [Anaerolineales bacterium]